MIKTEDTSVDNAAELRRRAEERIKKAETEDARLQTEPDALRLVHELQVHQIELELQNEELRNARDDADAWLELYTDLYDFAPVGYFTLARDGTILQLNLTGAKLLMVDRSNLVNRRFGLFVSPETRPEFNTFLESVFESQAKQICEVVVLTEANASSYMRIEAAVPADGDECRIAVADITEHKAAEARLDCALAELERSNTDLEQFAYVASHDLQEPLRMVASYVQLLAERYKGKLDEKADKYIGYAVDGAKRMSDLIKDLLEYSHVGTRGKPFEETDCKALIGTVIQNLSESIKESGAEIVVGKLPTLMADDVQLGQVFQNLISNAIKFHGNAPPRVKIDAQRRGAEWEFCVADNGIGIDPSFHERVFVMFQQLHERGMYHGTGVGLAITKKIVERHGGRIWIESEANAGSRFRFTIPATKNERRPIND